MRALLYFALVLISPDIFAGVFDPPPTDKSVELLGIIFGSNVGDIYLGGNPNAVLSQIMEKFNFIIVSVGLVVLAYVSILATINTAQEGTAMGKKWSAVWIPMRSIAGMALMVPAPASGYSMIQVTVMWIVLQGIGAADQIWNIALEGLSSGVSATMGSQVSEDRFLKSASEKIVPELLAAAICMQTYYEASKTADPNIREQDFVRTKANYIKAYATDPKVESQPGQTDIYGSINFGVDDDNDPKHQAVCGSINIDSYVNGSSLLRRLPGETTATKPPDYENLIKKEAQRVYDTKKLAISTALSVLQPLADAIVNETNDDNNDGISDGSMPIPDLERERILAEPQGYYEAAADAYIKVMSQASIPNSHSGAQATGQIDAVAILDNSDAIKQVVDAGKNNGWITAGSFYFIFNRTMMNDIYPSAKKSPRASMGTISLPACEFDAPGSEEDEGPVGYSACYSNELSIPADDPKVKAMEALSLYPVQYSQSLFKHLAYGATYMQQTSKAVKGGDNVVGEASAIPGGVAGKLADATQSIIDSFTNTARSRSEDPLMAHAIIGREMMITAEILLLAAPLILLAINAASGWNFLGIGVGAVMSGIYLLAMFWPILVFLWTLGASLAIYAPLIPYMIFTLAAIGWLITVIESILAAPLIALGLTMPAGDEMGKLGTALMLLANIFLRPMLMIFGFLLAGALLKAVMDLVGFGMADVFETVNVNSMFAWAAVMFVYISFVISLTNQCFSLIYAVPDKILRWLGGPADQTNVSALQETKSGSEQRTKGLTDTGSAAIGKSSDYVNKQGFGGRAPTGKGGGNSTNKPSDVKNATEPGKDG